MAQAPPFVADANNHVIRVAEPATPGVRPLPLTGLP